MTEAMEHQITLTGRQSLTLTGVKSVENFDAAEIMLATVMGGLKICGKDLNISRLQLEEGCVQVAGKISLLQYVEGGGKKTKKLLSRLTR